MTADTGLKSAPAQAKGMGAFSPFRHRAFAILWCATVISNVGTWMHDVGASWLMTSMTTSPVIVALIQTATTLPIFLFALPAGALADVLDRRRLLLAVQYFLLVSVITLTLCVYFGWMNPPLLVAFTFILGIGAAFIAPAWQAIVPDLVDKPALSSAVALNGVGINISRAIGPALAGILIVQFSVTAVFVVNALSFLVVIAALLWWRGGQSAVSTLPKEALLGAIHSGLQYARHSLALRDTLWRAFAFFISACAFWALLPLIARQELNGSAREFGLMMASIGAGAVAGSFLLPKLKQKFSPGNVVSLASLLSACVLALTALSTSVIATLLLCATYGAAWIWVLASLNVSAQMALPAWVRARGLAVYLMVFFGSLSAGSFFWGGIASLLSIDLALYISATTLALGVALTQHRKLNQGEEMALSPAHHWPSPIVHPSYDEHSMLDRSPVLITIEYHVPEANQHTFATEMQKLGNARKRYGAFGWQILQDASTTDIYLESFMEISWLNHLRHHDRVDGEDKKLQASINQLVEGEPLVRHYFGPSSKSTSNH